MNGYEYLMKFLKEEGFRMNEEETYFSFKYQGNNFVAFKTDGPFLQIVMVCNTRDYARNQLLEVCNTMNDNKFIIKFVVNDPNVWCSYEFKPNKDITSDDFDTIFLQLDKATDELYEKLSK